MGLGSAEKKLIDARQRRIHRFGRGWGVPLGRTGDPKHFGRITATFRSDFLRLRRGRNIFSDGDAGAPIFQSRVN